MTSHSVTSHSVIGLAAKFGPSLAGIVVAATHRTMMDTGNVASVGSAESLDPIMPPKVTMMMAPVAEIS